MKRRLKPPVAAAPSLEAVLDADAVVQVKVWLVGISPMVWRRVLVPASFTLRALHGVIKVAMGWEGIHLYVFRLRAARYGSWELSASSPDVTLANLRFRKGARLIYEYDLNMDAETALRFLFNAMAPKPEAELPFQWIFQGPSLVAYLTLSFGSARCIQSLLRPADRTESGRIDAGQ
jgi:hypothetical protein